MQNLNNFNELRPISKMQSEQLTGKEVGNKVAPSEFVKFIGILWAFIPLIITLYLGCIIITDNIRTGKQIQVNEEAILNSPQMKEYRIKLARLQRELERQKRLKQLNVEGVSNPVQKNDLLNEQFRKKEIADNQAPDNTKKVMDYRQKLEIYRQAQVGKTQRQ